MTPLAARVFRNPNEAGPLLIEELAKAQFFECSRIYDMAWSMLEEEAGSGQRVTPYSEMAALPSEITVIEYISKLLGKRKFFLCIEEVGGMQFHEFQASVEGPGYKSVCSGSFFYGEKQAIFFPGMGGIEKSGRDQKTILDHVATHASLLEKMLLIINQPKLVETVDRKADRRVRKIQEPKFRGEVWHECHIRRGNHGAPSGNKTDIHMPLHYVRKHFKPSVAKWIDGYWRGNSEIGISLKNYIVH